MRIIWIPRVTWGASASTEKFISERTKVPAEDKTEIHVHHTAAVDGDDDTPNRWDYNEAVAYMKRLQWVRPDLGPLPYCDNVAITEELDALVFEGRGALTLGAHTGGHNWAGYGIGVLGNFDKADTPAALAARTASEWRVAQLRQEEGLVNLGEAKNPRGWNAWGHRDTSSKTCPGHSLYPLLADFDLDGGHMAHPYDSHRDFRTDHDIGSVPNWSPWEEYVDAGGTSVPESGTWAFTRADMAWVWQKFIKPLADRVTALEQGGGSDLADRVTVLETHDHSIKLTGKTGPPR